MNTPTTTKTKDKDKTAAAGAVAPASQPALAALSEQNREALRSSSITPEQLAALQQQAAQIASSGFEDRSSDLEGYWVPEAAPIHCKPEHVKLFDGQINETKPSALVSVLLLSPTVISKSNDEDDTNKKDIVMCPAGKKVGIWLKPGMRDIANCCGVETIVQYTGTKKVHKKPGMNPMKLFSVKSKPGGTRLPIEEDRREKSAKTATLFDVKRPGGQAPGRMDDDASAAADDLPF